MVAFEHWRLELGEIAAPRQAALDRWMEDAWAEARAIGGFPTLLHILGRKVTAGPPLPHDRGARDHLGDALAPFSAGRGRRGPWVVGPQGVILASAGAAAAGPAVVEAGLAAMSTQQPSVSFERDGATDMVLFAVPVLDPQEAAPGAVGSVVLAEDADEFAKGFLDTSHHGAAVSVFLVERRPTGTMRVYPAVTGLGRLPLDRWPDGAPVFGELEGPGGRVFVHARPLRHAPLWLMASVNRAEAVQAALPEAVLTGLATFGVLLGAALLARELLRRAQAQHAAELGKSLAEVQRPHHILEQIPVSVVVTDPDGRIEYVNACFSEVTGYSREEVLGRDPRFLEATPLPAEFYAEIEATIRSGAPWRGQFENRHKDGRLVWEEAVISPGKDDAGRITHFIAVKQDVTELHRREAQLRASRIQLAQAQKMDALGRLAGGIAHDFNNLLGVIVGYADLVLRRLADQDPLRQKIEEIAKAAERGAGLTRQLLAYGRKQVLALTVVDLNDAVGNVSEMLSRLIGEDVELVLEPGPELARVRVDRGQIEQVLLNLAANARDAMPQGGKLRLRTSNEDVDENDPRRRGLMPPGRYVRLAVSDTGVGMSEEVLSHMFEPFFTTKEHGRGTGLGLPTVYGIVKQSSGFIWVDSTPGGGATFEIFLPAVEAPAAPLARPASPARLPAVDPDPGGQRDPAPDGERGPVPGWLPRPGGGRRRGRAGHREGAPRAHRAAAERRGVASAQRPRSGRRHPAPAPGGPDALQFRLHLGHGERAEDPR